MGWAAAGVVVAVLGLLVTVVALWVKASVDAVGEKLGRQLDAVESRLGARIDVVGSHLALVEQRVGALERGAHPGLIVPR